MIYCVMKPCILVDAYHLLEKNTVPLSSYYTVQMEAKSAADMMVPECQVTRQGLVQTADWLAGVDRPRFYKISNVRIT